MAARGSCTVCAHPKVHDISAELLRGVSHARIAARFGLHKASVGRHFRTCIPAAMHEAAAAQGAVRIEAIEGAVLLGQAGELYQRALDTLDELELPGKDQRARVAALRELRMSLETLAKLAFAVEDRGKAPERVGAPAIDAAIVAALAARGVNVDQRPGSSSATAPAAPLALPAAST